MPQQSPITQMNTLFFDENASCHLAFGNGFPIGIEGGAAMTKDELHGRGVNASAVHVDFMIGSGDLAIDGVTASGEIVPLFRKGDWVV
jgi:aminopeptidase